MRWVTGQFIPNDLKDVFDPGCIVNVDIGDIVIALREERQLEVSIMIGGLENFPLE